VFVILGAYKSTIGFVGTKNFWGSFGRNPKIVGS